MRNIIWFTALFGLLLIQAGIFQPLGIAPVNLALIVVALAVILSDFGQGLVITLMAGLLLDFIAGSPDGLISMSLLIMFLALHFVLNEILARDANRYILAVSTAAGTILYFLAFVGLSRIFGWFELMQNLNLRYVFLTQLPLTLIWNLVFAYPIYIVYVWVQSLASKIKTDEESIRI